MITGNVCKPAAQLLFCELTRRFGHCKDTENVEFNPIFAIATSLDPRYKWILNEKDNCSNSEKLLEIVRKTLVSEVGSINNLPAR